MADSKISLLTPIVTVLDPIEFAINDAGSSKKITRAQMFTNPNVIGTLSVDTIDVNTTATDLIIKNTELDRDIIFQVNDGSVSEVLRIDGSSSDVKFFGTVMSVTNSFSNITIDNNISGKDISFRVTPTGGSLTSYLTCEASVSPGRHVRINAPDGLFLADNIPAKFGSGSGTDGDGKIYSDGADLYIDNITLDRDIIIRVNDGTVQTTLLTFDGDVSTVRFNQNAGFSLGSSNNATHLMSSVNYIINATTGKMTLTALGQIELKPSNDTDDYLVISSVTDEVFIGVDDDTDLLKLTANNLLLTGSLTTTSNISIQSGSEARFYDVGNSNYVGFEAPALIANQIWILPDQDGTNGQVLQTNGTGTLSWTTVSGGSTEFADNVFRIVDNADSSKKLAFEVSNITTATVQTVAVQDSSMTLLSTTDYTDLTDSGDSTLHFHSTDRARANHTGSQLAATISNFQTTVSANSDVSTSLAHVTSSGNDHTNINQNVTTTGTPSFTSVTVGNTGLTVGTSIPFSDSTGVLTLQNIDVIDTTTRDTISVAITALNNLATIQSHTFTLTGAFIRSGAHSLTLTTTATTALTLPTTGTLVTLAGNESLTTKSIVVNDHGTASVDEVVNVCYGTSATPPTASTTTEGALYVQYTA